jgi:hypothetical protein
MMREASHDQSRKENIMKTRNLYYSFTRGLVVAALPLAITACGVLGLESSSSDTSDSSDESDVEAAFDGAVEALIDSTTSSSSDVSDAVATLTTDSDTSFVVRSGYLRAHFRCESSSQVDNDFTCDDDAGTMTRVVTFDDCEIQNSFRDADVNGSFTNTITNGGEGMCNDEDETVDFSRMVIGRDGANATHEHATGDEGMGFNFTNSHGKDVVITTTTSHTITYSDPVDADADGAAESVTATIDRTLESIHTIDGGTAHDVTVFTTDTDFTSTDSDGEQTTIEVALPVRTLNFADDGTLDTRTIESGNLIVDHNLAHMRLVFGVGEDGLTFDDGTTCGPLSGTMTVTGYAINDDDSIGSEIGSGTVTFDDGDVESAEFDGESLNLRPRPCH